MDLEEILADADINKYDFTVTMVSGNTHEGTLVEYNIRYEYFTMDVTRDNWSEDKKYVFVNRNHVESISWGIDD
ncbi:hypothetical protein ACFXG4_23505 [Nocardia sp. NPDC059246]|uniref:hypothetical protein n=1 Tax=unclassified Nocardia TaxID=2637762 RepID=UPI0036C2D187